MIVSFLGEPSKNVKRGGKFGQSLSFVLFLLHSLCFAFPPFSQFFPASTTLSIERKHKDIKGIYVIFPSSFNDVTAFLLNVLWYSMSEVQSS